MVGWEKPPLAAIPAPVTNPMPKSRAWLGLLLWLEPLWVVGLGLPLTLPGRFVPVQYTPTLILLLFVFWPLRWLDWQRRGLSRLGMAQPFMRWLLLLLATLPVSYLVADDKRMAWLMLAHLLWGVALALALLHWPLTRRWPGLVIAMLVGLALLLSVIGPPMMSNTLRSPRALALFAPLVPLVRGWGETINANILAGGMVLGVPLVLALALQPWRQGVWARLGDGVRLALGLALTWWLVQVLALTGSRGALLAAGMAMLVVIVLRWPRLWLPALGVVVAGLLWIMLNDPMFYLNALMADGVGREYNGRMEIWVRAWQALWRHPLTGIGIGGFVPEVVEGMPMVRFPLNAQVTHAHNLLLQVGVDLGLVGLLAYAAIVVSSGMGLARVWRHDDARQRTLAGAGLGALTALMVHGLVDAPLWNSKLAFMPWLLYALAALVRGDQPLAHAQLLSEESSDNAALDNAATDAIDGSVTASAAGFS